MTKDRGAPLVVDDPSPASARGSRLRRSLLAVLTLVLAAATLAACGDDGEEGDDVGGGGDDELIIEDVWSRTSAGSQTTGAAYMVLTGGAEDDRLVAASVPTEIAATTEVHETVPVDEAEMDMTGSTDTSAMADEDHDGDMAMEDEGHAGMEGMTMQEVDGIDIPADESVALEPGGFHVMMLDLAAPLEAGETFEITLTFEIAGERTVTAEVRDA